MRTCVNRDFERLLGFGTDELEGCAPMTAVQMPPADLQRVM